MKAEHSELFYYAMGVYAVATIAIVALPFDPTSPNREAKVSAGYAEAAQSATRLSEPHVQISTAENLR